MNRRHSRRNKRRSTKLLRPRDHTWTRRTCSLPGFLRQKPSCWQLVSHLLLFSCSQATRLRMSTTFAAQESTILSKLDSAVPAPLAQFDAFPKLPSTYKSRSESRGFFTLFVGFLAFLLMLNDIGEYIWGWPDYEFSVDNDKSSYMNINVDLVVNMPCRCESDHAYVIWGAYHTNY